MSSLLLANRPRRAFAVLEYVMMIIILATGLYMFRSYIQRGFQGQYRRTGESFGFTRQYNPGASRDCVMETLANATGPVTYEKGCFNNKILALGCARKAPGNSYDNCITGAQTGCTAPCNFE
jgi:hypothetical protein